jgi:hypothetical protein
MACRPAKVETKSITNYSSITRIPFSVTACMALHGIRVGLLLFGQIANAFPVNFPSRVIPRGQACSASWSANQPAVLFSNIKSAPATSHLPVFSLTTNQHRSPATRQPNMVSNLAALVFVYAADQLAIGTSVIAARRRSSCAHDPGRSSRVDDPPRRDSEEVATTDREIQVFPVSVDPAMSYWLEPPGLAGHRQTRVFRAGEVTCVVSPIPAAPLLNSIITATTLLRLNVFMNGQMLLFDQVLATGDATD